ncbi:MAG: hypothetical protein ACWGOL_01880 [Desulfuromonadales bacterium]
MPESTQRQKLPPQQTAGHIIYPVSFACCRSLPASSAVSITLRGADNASLISGMTVSTCIEKQVAFGASRFQVVQVVAVFR